jgi:hypothetical protein
VYNMTSSPWSSHDLERRANDLYNRYGARPWPQLPEGTREHFRRLVQAGIDGSGNALD